MVAGSASAMMALGLTLYMMTKRGIDGPESYVVNHQYLDPEYDFVVIGGGTAGSVVASRLSEIGNWKVLLLEAGGDEVEFTDVPNFAAGIPNSVLDWAYRTEPQSNFCLGLKERRCHWTSGKVLGGSSVLNYMLYVRGNRRDYDNWYAMGNPGWDYDSVLPYFMKAEGNQNDEYLASGYHGSEGPLTVSDVPWLTPLSDIFLQAGKQLGYRLNDGNGLSQTGFMVPQGTIRKGARCSTNKAYLRAARNRPNLHVAKNALVERVTWEDDTESSSPRRVSGVRFRRGRHSLSVKVKREAIITAGALRTPQLLMLSGIGAARHLRDRGIRPVVDLPGVGENLQDHISPGGLVFLIDKPLNMDANRIVKMENLMQWLQNRKGPLTSLGGVEGLAWVNSPLANSSDDWPDIQLHFASGSLLNDWGRQKTGHGLSDAIWNATYSDLQGNNSWSVLPMILRPKSKGYVQLRSSNPKDQPLFYPNYLSDPHDLKVILEGIKLTLSLAETPAFAKLNSRLLARPLPPCSHLSFKSDAYWECHLRQYTVTEHHFCGTAKMGPNSDSMAVVDNGLRVKGVQGLRVMDASVMPAVPSGNINAAVVMLAEKGSDIVKQDWFLSQITSRQT